MRSLPSPVDHDLPPRWDGRAVEWRGWQTAWTTVSLHVRQQDRCEGCGSTAQQQTNAGVVHPLPGEMFEGERTKRARRSGREYIARGDDMPAWPVLRLFAYRCPDCGLDVVWDEERDEWWTLDASDYGDDGSVAP